MRAVFRPASSRWGCYAVYVSLFAVGGCIGLAVSDDPTFGCWVLLGWPTVFLILLRGRTRVLVDEVGVTKRSWTGGAFRAAWADIESWAVEELVPTALEADSITSRLVRLRVRGARWEAKVTDSEAEVPPFEEFVQLLRDQIPQTEIAGPQLTRDQRPPAK
jgi:hypothetical protein